MKRKKKNDKGESTKSIGEFAVDVLRAQGAKLRESEAGTRAGADIEALHDMRVAARRLRAAIRLFQPVLPKDWEESRRELAWLAAQLGEVRDLDVLIAHVEGWLPKLRRAANPTLSLLEAIRSERESRREALLAALDSDRYRALLINLSANLSKRRKGEAESPVHGKLPGLIERRYRRFLRGVKALGPNPEPEAKHLVRILAKRLRYGVEFSVPLYGKRAEKLGRTLAQLQDVFGALQDAHMARVQLEKLVGDREGLQSALPAILSRYDDLAAKEWKREGGILGDRLPREWERYRHRMEKLSNSR